MSLATPHALAQPASPPPSGYQGGILAFDTADLLRPPPNTFLSFDLLRALAPWPNAASRSFDLTDQGEASLANRIRTVLAAPAPATPKAARRTAGSLTPEVRAARAAILAAGKLCPPFDDVSPDDPCRLQAAITDYENVLGDPYLTPVSVEAARFARPLPVAARHALEARLERITALIRARAAMDHPAAKLPAKVHVVIDPALGLNIQSAYGSDTIRIGEAVVLDVYFRALHRAIVARRIDGNEQQPFDDCRACDTSLRKSGVYVRSFERLTYLTQNAPGMRLHYVSSHWLADAIVKGCEALPLAKRQTLAQHLTEEPDTDPREDEMDVVGLETYLPCATDGRHRISSEQTSIYTEEIQNGRNLGEEIGEPYIKLVEESLWLNQQLSAELAKAYLFLLAHETYHLWGSDSLRRDVEFEADAHGAKVYLQVFRDVNVDDWLKAVGAGPDVMPIGGRKPGQVMTTVLGRDPIQVLNETYAGTQYYDGSWSHPPVAQRVARLRALIEGGERSELCKALLDAQRSEGAAAPLTQLDLSACARASH